MKFMTEQQQPEMNLHLGQSIYMLSEVPCIYKYIYIYRVFYIYIFMADAGAAPGLELI